jgi:DNA polymerase-1
MKFSSYENCQKCKLYENRTHLCWGEGPEEIKMMFIGCNPGAEDDAIGSPFHGPSGELLRELITQVGLPFTYSYFTNLVLCKTKDGKAPKDECMEACSPRLDEEITALKPSIIIPVGNEAMERILGFKGITKHNGKLYFSEKYNCKVIPIISPSAVIKTGKYRDDILIALGKVQAEIFSTKTSKIPDGDYKIITTLTEALAQFEKLKSEAKELVFDIETAGLNYRKDNVLGVGFSWRERQGIYLPLFGQNEAVIWDSEQFNLIINKIKESLESAVPKIAHNCSFDMKFLTQQFSIKVNNVYFDTMLAHHLLDEEGAHGLKALAEIYTDIGGYESEIGKFLKKKSDSYALVPTDILGKYCCIDCDVTMRLYNILKPKLKEQCLDYLFENLVMPLRKELTQTELRGVLIDIPKLKVLKEAYVKDIAGLEIKMKQIVTESTQGEITEVNWGSPKQLQEILFTRLGLKAAKVTKKGAASTGEEALLALEGQHPLIECILEYRTKSKLVNTFLDSLEELADENGRIHTNYLTHGAATGRLSSAAPNLQNIPAKASAGVRSLFIPEPGHKLLVCDYGQIELRIMAQYSQDKTMLQVFNTGGDIHQQVACQVFDVTPEHLKELADSDDPLKRDEAKHMRLVAKGINFGILYGRGPRSLAEELKITQEDGQKFLNQYFQRFPGVYSFQNNTHALVQLQKHVRSVFGRIRRLPDAALPDNDGGGYNRNPLIKSNKERRSHALRQSVNALIQGTASDCTALSTIKIMQKFRELGLPIYLVLTVHDELCFECPENLVTTAVPIIKDIMEHPTHIITVPLVVDIKVCDTWAEK